MTETQAARQPSVAWLAALKQPQLVLGWSLAEWDFVVRLARRLRLLARLAESLDAAGLLPQVPAPVLPHLLAAQRVSRFRTRAAVWLMERAAAAFVDASRTASGFNNGSSGTCGPFRGQRHLGKGSPDGPVL